MSRILLRKLRRDLWRQRWQFLAVALVIAIGVSVYVAASDAYRNLQPAALGVSHGRGPGHVRASVPPGRTARIIGTFAANGVSGRSLRRHYLTYGVAAGLAGAVPGLIGGYCLGGWFTTRYTDALGLPLHVTSLHPLDLLIGAAVGAAAAALAAWVPARAAARISPAEGMRVSLPDVSGGFSVTERVVPALRRLPARWRMTLRGVMRNRRRTLLTLLGVAVSVILVMVFAGMRDTVAV